MYIDTHACLQISVTPLGALSPAEIDGVTFFKEWLPAVSAL